jgi:hypothetical protein
MGRLIKLLPGDRETSNDCRRTREGYYVLDMRSPEVDKVDVDCTRWLEGATITTATVDNTGISASLATPIVTLTITAPGTVQYDNRLTITASDGRKRMIDFLISLDGDDRAVAFDDYGWVW